MLVHKGGPAVGKGTHCNSLAVELGVTHVSVGDLLRAETKKPGAQHKALIEERMLEGSLAPNDIVQEILEDFLVENIKQGSTKFLIDGFPRSKEQASDFQGRVSLKFSYPMPSKMTLATLLKPPGLQHQSCNPFG